MDEVFLNDFKKLLTVTNIYLETFYNYIDIQLPELAAITLKNLGRDLPDHIKKTESLKEPSSPNLKRIKGNYIDWLKAQLKSCQLLNKYEESPDNDKLQQWQDSFSQAKNLQIEVGRLIIKEKALENLSLR